MGNTKKLMIFILMVKKYRSMLMKYNLNNSFNETGKAAELFSEMAIILGGFGDGNNNSSVRTLHLLKEMCMLGKYLT